MSQGQPDWAALYQRHKDAMHRVAASVLRAAGLADQANDVVSDAMTSLINSPPADVQNWEAVMVTAAKRKALDLLRSAAVRHAGPELDAEYDQVDPVDIAEDVADQVDRERARAVAWDGLSVLDARHRRVVWEYIALERPRADVAAELGVSPARVSQMAKRALQELRRYVDEQGGAA
ncbi:sigma-70 family RNA polymerase sigma factor [Amycolatopsis sp. QT-25]|uniref:RNA polymerase sigma factor n=1 Tax=Amycolatopsis sp. QT-25 TaxID=3034022 RepID=UPI0023EA9063|nr:sigma-70 family RNA polymerase sigma factor [Amycolatopsis sp. QT-25]WET79037.1 sigma-70 family RNA polymerase sigma factor [Amycolatopsis sp. QT-25]